MRQRKDLSWLLIDMQLGPDFHKTCLELLVRCCDKECGESFKKITVPVMPTGSVHELVRVPDDYLDIKLGLPAGATHPQIFNVRRVGLSELSWRLYKRIHDCFVRLTRAQRLYLGLTRWKSIFNPAAAYEIATKLRFPFSYVDWHKSLGALCAEDINSIHRHVSMLSDKPNFKIILLGMHASYSEIAVTLDSLRKQLYSNFTCSIILGEVEVGEIADESSLLVDQGCSVQLVHPHQQEDWLKKFNDSRVLENKNEWIFLIHAGDVLSPDALYRFACATLDHTDAAIWYADEDRLNAQGLRCKPQFKPDWSLTHFRSTNFVGDAVIFRGREVVAAGGLSLDTLRYGTYDLLLHMVEAAGDDGENLVSHVPAVLLHRAEASSRSIGDDGRNMATVHAHLVRKGIAAEVLPFRPACWRVKLGLPASPPLVSIIIPTRNNLPLIMQCVESLLAKTSYSRFEALVVDNQSTDAGTLDYLATLDGRKSSVGVVRVLRYNKPFNFSAINNFAVSEARGEVICLLNNDTEVISPDWLDEMVGQLFQSKVGAVGAKLYFPDGRVQHAGDVVGVSGCAHHLHSMLAHDDPGYCNRAVVAQELSAVTAACLLTRKDIYQKVGGLDETYLKVAFNDVDYCLKLRKAGYKVVWTPHAELYHHESASRGKASGWRKILRSQKEVIVMRWRWRRELQDDPFYNPNLSYVRPDFSMSHVVRVKKPWRDF